jgi:hypothetical protein
VRAELASLRLRTVARPAYDAAVALLDQTRRHLDLVRAEVFRSASFSPLPLGERGRG